MGRPLDEMEFTVTRRPGDWDGPWEHGTPTTFTILASRPQPVGPETIEMLPEAARTTARFIIYAHDDQPEVYTIETYQPGFSADTIAYKGKAYLVTTDGDWADMPLGYNGYILLAYGPDEKVPS